MSGPRWVIHLPTALTSPEVTADLVVALRDSLARVPALDFGEVTLSEEDKQHHRLRIYCDAAVGEGRCRLRDGHSGACQQP